MSRSLCTRPLSRVLLVVVWLGAGLVAGNLPSHAKQPDAQSTPAEQSYAPGILTLQTVPAGLQVKVDGTTYKGGAQLQVDPGKVRVLRSVAPQSRGGKTFSFSNWSDGGCSVHPIITPANPKTITAHYKVTRGPVSTVGVFRAGQSSFFLRKSNSSGPADMTVLFGATTDLPVVGDWNGDGIDNIGLFRPSQGLFILRESNSTSAPIAYQFNFGGYGDIPVAGDWDGDGKDSIGVFRPSLAHFLLRNSLSTGPVDNDVTFGAWSDWPVVGDWNADGVDTPGIYRPSQGSFFLTNKNCNCAPPVNHSLAFGGNGDRPVVGDWNGNGVTGVGVFRGSTGQFFLRNNPTSTGAADYTLSFGGSSDMPIAGHWSSGYTPAPIFEPNTGALTIDPEVGSGSETDPEAPDC